MSNRGNDLLLKLLQFRCVLNFKMAKNGALTFVLLSK